MSRADTKRARRHLMESRSCRTREVIFVPDIWAKVMSASSVLFAPAGDDLLNIVDEIRHHYIHDSGLPQRLQLAYIPGEGGWMSFVWVQKRLPWTLYSNGAYWKRPCLNRKSRTGMGQVLSSGSVTKEDTGITKINSFLQGCGWFCR
jgi:hypothetical protein